MRSSTSNSDIHLSRRFIPGGPWLMPLVVAMLLMLALMALEEYALARRGFVPTIVDSPSIWAKQRARADSLGGRALILIGASRIQLDLDLAMLRDATGKEPIQLAIDGSSFVGVLADLAADERVRGTVIVDYQDHVIDTLDPKDASAAYLAEWQRYRGRSSVPDFHAAEGWLADHLHSRLRAFADGATPFRSLALRALDTKATPQYLITLPSRERRADYSQVAMPQFYYERVKTNAGLYTGLSYSSWQDLDAKLRQRIDALPAANLAHFESNSIAIAGMVRRIEDRGGHVVFAMFPRSGLVRYADERMFPRARYWDRFVQTIGAPALDYRDVGAMSQFTCPDGSHLDARDKARFTRAFINALHTRTDPSSRSL